jgi:hypothetical protein
MSFAYNPLQTGGGSGSGRTTVGASGATYQTLSDAVTAGAYVLAVVADVTEDSTIFVPEDGLDIFIDNDAILNMGTNFFNVGANGLNIQGNGTLSYGNIPGPLFSGIADAELTVEGITIDNNASTSVCITNIDYARFSDIIFDGNVRVCGDSNLYHDCIYRASNIQIITGITNTMIDGSIFESSAIADSGTNTVIADAVVY